MEYNLLQIKEKARIDFEKTWLDTSGLIDFEGRKFPWDGKRGKEHPLIALNEKFRNVFLKIGLDEIVHSAIIEEKEVYRQYGPEAPLILDRVFYLSGLPRPDIGVSKRKIEEIRQIIPDFTKEKELIEIFRAFKKGDIESDNLIEELANSLQISGEQATMIIERVFPEFKGLTPVPTRLTLRSHMTAAWFNYLSKVQHKIPSKLFSIGSRFRREQRLDPYHLYESTSASVVLMNDELSLEDGVEFTKQILGELGFGKPEFVPKMVTSKYYTPDTEQEVYSDVAGQRVEVANIGFYSPVALANYNIRYPVFNLGFGVERLAMLSEKVTDIRALVYGEAFAKISLSDEEMAQGIGLEEKPVTSEGENLAKTIVDSANLHKNDIGPVEVLAYHGRFMERDVHVLIYNWDQGKKMLSMAAFNEVYVYDSSIIGLPKELPSLDSVPNKKRALLELAKQIKGKGINTNICYLEAVVKGFVAELEKAVKREEREIDQRFKMINRASEINISISEEVNYYIMDNNKKIEIAGPMFFGLKAEIS